ncbi:MAG: hypothetical protein IJ960_01290 [Oscillospiraceae bacterium]|nr:hypothetical protein [Oscillospiraceae bacterium]
MGYVLAVGNGRFAHNTSCARARIGTFLYRALEEAQPHNALWIDILPEFEPVDVLSKVVFCNPQYALPNNGSLPE